jgi:hypothetical protein
VTETPVGHGSRHHTAAAAAFVGAGTVALYSAPLEKEPVMRKHASAFTGLSMLLLALVPAACSTARAPGEDEGATPAQRLIPARTRDQLVELGRQHATAAGLYEALAAEAKNGRRLAAANLPDWTGIYTRARGGITFDPDQPPGAPPTARLTPEFKAKLDNRIAMANKGVEWDPISTCAPPGHPRWLTEPFLKEFVVTPDQTWLINEMVNDVRRIYTDGRAHVPVADRYPLYNGDSIGFWDGDALVIHTNQLSSGIYQRRNPDFTDQVETVEIWRKVDPKLIEVDVWVYDPPALTEPWYVKQAYAKLDDPDKSLRIRYWNCGENQNNSVYQTEQGATQFRDFTFTDTDNRK